MNAPPTAPSSVGSQQQSYKAWLMLLLFSALSFANGFQWIVISAVALTLQQFFETTLAWINAQSMLYMFVYLVEPLASSLIQRRGLRFTLLVAALLNALGAVCRAIGAVRPTPESPNLFPLVTLGTVFASMAQVGILSVPGLLAQRWFSTAWRPVATSVAALANQLGIAVAFILTPVCVVTGADFLNFSIGIAAVCVALVGALALLFEEVPRVAPSLSEQLRRHDAGHTGLLAGAAVDHHHQHHGDAVVTPNTVRAAIAVLLRNRHFMLSAVAFGLGTGVFYGWSTVLVQLAGLYKISELQAGQIGFAMISVGLIGAIGVGFILPRFNRTHAMLLRLSLLVATAATAYFMAALELNWPIAHAFIAASLFGIAVTALVPIAIELGTEVTFPVSSDFSAGFQLVLAQIVGIVLIIILTVLLDNELTIESLIAMVALCFAAALLSFFVRVTYTRLELDAKKADTDPHHQQHHDSVATTAASTGGIAAAVSSATTTTGASVNIN